MIGSRQRPHRRGAVTDNCFALAGLDRRFGWSHVYRRAYYAGCDR
jgi:hypothetical protein